MKTKARLMTNVALAFGLIALASTAKANLVVNGGFESNDGFHGATGWTFTPAGSGSDFFYGGSAIGPHSGASDAQFGGVSSGSYDTITQTIATVSGAAYTFSFWMAANDPADNGQIASWDGTQLLNMTNFSQGYVFYSFSVVGTGSDTVEFDGYNVPSWNGVDDVSVTGAVPEPGTLGMLLGGAGMLGLALRRKLV